MSFQVIYAIYQNRNFLKLVKLSLVGHYCNGLSSWSSTPWDLGFNLRLLHYFITLLAFIGLVAKYVWRRKTINYWLNWELSIIIQGKTQNHGFSFLSFLWYCDNQGVGVPLLDRKGKRSNPWAVSIIVLLNKVSVLVSKVAW